MGISEAEAFAELVRASADLLEHSTVPRHVVAVISLPDCAHDVVVFESHDWNNWRNRIEKRRVRIPSPTLPSIVEVIRLVAAFREEFSIHEDFVFKQLEDPRVYTAWTLVHAATLFPRYVCGVRIPVSRGYEKE